MTIAAIAWDIDGTLVDSEPLHHRALLAAGRRWGADLTDVTQESFRGVHMGDVWSALAPRFPPDLGEAAWLAAIDDHYAEGAGTLTPLAGALAAVRAFAARGLPQVCVSNSNRRVVDANLAALGIEDVVAWSISLDDVSRGKPDPEPYRLACARLELPPSSVLGIEDSRAGFESARSAGLVLAVYAADVRRFPEAHVVVNALEDLVAWVDARA